MVTAGCGWSALAAVREGEDWEVSGVRIGEVLLFGTEMHQLGELALLRWWLGAERHRPKCGVPRSVVAQEGTGKKCDRV